MAFDLAPMIESLHRAPCAAHMLLSMVAQSIVTVGHKFSPALPGGLYQEFAAAAGKPLDSGSAGLNP